MNLDQLHCAEFRITSDRTLISANNTFTEWVGLSESGTSLDPFLQAGVPLFWETTIAPMLMHSGQALDVALDFDGPNGEVSLVGNLVVEGGEIVGVFLRFDLRREFERVMAAAEAKARQQQEEIDQLHKLDRMRLDFINSAAHEIATPLTPILLQLHLLQKKVQGDDAKPLASIKRNLESLQEFSNDLRHAAALESLDTLQLTRTDVANIATALAPDECEGGPAMSMADERWLTVALQKLIENAHKFGEGKAIAVSVHENPPRIVVRDEGVGLAPEQLGRLGQPFVQLHDKSKLTMLGPGLGLYIARRAIELMGGSLACHSDGIGTGFTATVTLPEA